VCSLNFIKAVFAGKKSLILQRDIIRTTVPKYGEFSFKDLFEKIKDNETVTKHFTDQSMSKKQPTEILFQHRQHAQ